MKETKIQQTQATTSQKTVENINWRKGTVRVLDNLTNKSIETLNRILTDKDKIINSLETKIKQLTVITNEQLLRLLSERIKSEEIKSWWSGCEYINALFIEDAKGEKILSIDLDTGKIEEKAKKEPVLLFDEFEKKDNSSKLVKISGILTSQIRSKPSSDTPFMAFLRPNSANENHSLAECEAQKCQQCEIPVIFRVKSKEIIHKDCWTKGNCQGCQKEEIKPNLNKGDKVLLEGKFENSKNSNRPSFTAYSFEIINSHGRN